MEKKLRSIKTLCPKPSMAVRAAIKGITRLSKKKEFQVDMGSYGSVCEVSTPKPICVGCLATAAIMEIAKITPKQFIEAYSGRSYQNHGISNHAERFNLDMIEIDRFESAINDLRYWDVDSLVYIFYEAANFEYTEPILALEEKGNIETENWEEQLPNLEILAVELEKQGL